MLLPAGLYRPNYENRTFNRCSRITALNTHIQPMSVHRLFNAIYGRIEVGQNDDGFALRIEEIPYGGHQMEDSLHLAKAYTKTRARKTTFLYEYNRCGRSVRSRNVGYTVP